MQLLSGLAAFHLAGFGGEQLIELGVFWEVIRKGQDDIVEE